MVVVDWFIDGNDYIFGKIGMGRFFLNLVMDVVVLD